MKRVTRYQSRIRSRNTESKSKMCPDPPPDPQWFAVCRLVADLVQCDLLWPLVCACVPHSGSYHAAGVAKLGPPAAAPVALQRTFYAVVQDLADFILRGLENFPWASIFIHSFIQKNYF